MNRRLFTRVTLAVCALASVPAFAQNKVVMGVAIPAATHGWTGGVVYWANRTKGELVLGKNVRFRPGFSADSSKSAGASFGSLRDGRALRK